MVPKGPSGGIRLSPETIRLMDFSCVPFSPISHGQDGSQHSDFRSGGGDSDTKSDVSHRRTEQPAGARRGSAVNNSAAPIVNSTLVESVVRTNLSDAATLIRSGNSPWSGGGIRADHQSRHRRPASSTFAHGLQRIPSYAPLPRWPLFA